MRRPVENRRQVELQARHVGRALGGASAVAPLAAASLAFGVLAGTSGFGSACNNRDVGSRLHRLGPVRSRSRLWHRKWRASDGHWRHFSQRTIRRVRLSGTGPSAAAPSPSLLQDPFVLDESWGVAMNPDGSVDVARLVGAGCLPYVSWASGTAIGAMGTQWLPVADRFGLDAAFPASSWLSPCRGWNPPSADRGPGRSRLTLVLTPSRVLHRAVPQTRPSHSGRGGPVLGPMGYVSDLHMKEPAMFVADIADAPRRERDGLLSHVLLQEGDVPDTALTVTWVEVPTGSFQRSHRHEPEQAYVIVSGHGSMTVGRDEQEVRTGQLIHVPSQVPHAIRNTGREPLRYVSASSPAFRITDLYDTGELARRTTDLVPEPEDRP
jgi:mannose-6-phosphate isomerase-like protein (cupin superfamily)